MFFNKATVTIVLSILCAFSYVNYKNIQKTQQEILKIAVDTRQAVNISAAIGDVVVAYTMAYGLKKQKQQERQETLTCLTQNLYFEGGNQSHQGLLALGQIVKQRQESPKYPNTICEVVKQKKWSRGRWVGQFSWYTDGKPDRMPTNAIEIIAWNKAQQIAKTFMESEYNVDPELNNATLYHADYVTPNWDMDKIRLVKKVDDHLFYEEI